MSAPFVNNNYVLYGFVNVNAVGGSSPLHVTKVFIIFLRLLKCSLKDGRGASPQKRVMKQIQITKKQESKGFRGIIDATSVLSQVLKQFDGIYSVKLPDTDGLTIEEWMEYMGVPRFTQTSKNGKVTKKGYTPGLINAAWDTNMLLRADNGDVFGNCVYKNVAAKYMMMDSDERERAYRVYSSEEEALATDGKPISRYQLVEVPKNKWSVRTILTGLRQSRHHDKESEKSKKSYTAWEEVEECWIVVSNGTVRTAMKVDKKSVVF